MEEWTKDLLEFWYTHVGDPFDITKDLGILRLEFLKQRFKRILNKLKISLNEKSKVLSVLAGTGVDAFALAETYGCRVVCVEYLQSLAEKGKKYAKKNRLRVEFIVGDAKKLVNLIDEKDFDLAILWGNSLPHIDIYSLDKIASQVNQVLADSSPFLLEYFESVYSREYRFVTAEFDQYPMISIHLDFNPMKGCANRLLLCFKENGLCEYIKYPYFTWSPWIVEYVLRKTGFGEVVTIIDEGAYVTAGWKT